MLRINKIDCVTEELNAKRLLKSRTAAAAAAAAGGPVVSAEAG